MPGSCISLPSLLTIACGDLSPTSGPGVPHPMALSLEAASGVSGSYSMSGSPVAAPAPHQAGILGLISSFTPLRMAGPSQGSTETLDPDSARSSPFEERRRRVKEEGKVNVTGGEVGGLGLGTLVPDSHLSWGCSCSGWWWHRRGAVPTPGTAGELWSWPKAAAGRGEGTGAHLTPMPAIGLPLGVSLQGCCSLTPFSRFSQYAGIEPVDKINTEVKSFMCSGALLALP